MQYVDQCYWQGFEKFWVAFDELVDSIPTPMDVCSLHVYDIWYNYGRLPLD